MNNLPKIEIIDNNVIFPKVKLDECTRIHKNKNFFFTEFEERKFILDFTFSKWEDVFKDEYYYFEYKNGTFALFSEFHKIGKLKKQNIKRILYIQYDIIYIFGNFEEDENGFII